MVRWETDAEHRFTSLTCYGGVLRDDEGRGVLMSYSSLGRTRWEMADADPVAPVWRAHIADLNAHRPFADFSYLIRLRSGRRVRARTSGYPRFKENQFLGYTGNVYFTKVVSWVDRIAG